MEVFDHWHGSRQGWATASAQTLLALLLFAGGHHRRQQATLVPWSVARAWLMLREDTLRTHLADTITHVEDPAARHATSTALRDLHFHHQYDEWESSDGMFSPGGPDQEDYFHHGLPVAVQMLDAVLLAERGGWPPDSAVQVTTPLGGGPDPATVAAPIWQTDPPRPDDLGMLDLAAGPPAGYAVRVHGYIDMDVRAPAVTATPAASPSENAG